MAMTREERAARRTEKKAEEEAQQVAYRAKVEADARKKALVREVARRLFGPNVGCGDGGCVFGHPGGMHTNGGCRCIPVHRDDVFECARVARMLAAVAHELASLKT